MKTGSEFHVGIVGLGSMGMGAALSCVRAGLSTLSLIHISEPTRP